MQKITIHTSLKGKGITVQRNTIPRIGEYISTPEGHVNEVQTIVHCIDTGNVLVIATETRLTNKELSELTSKKQQSCTTANTAIKN